ncbi:MAG: bifunctional phosphopantothenoylcysteine decarboxylase/phosphopantothenate--cysteine ligase CoaBC [Bacteroidia bacterium]|nr:bifunctional phosphopantothenoylcysteine decarboxylase/phosphopantothenate--cysteine ligase CoaBC [Bacteroidia bacterium]
MKNKKIIIAISASIAAYKAAFLVRLLVKAGADVKVIITPAAKEFVTPLTLSTLSKNPVYSDFVLNQNGEWTNHVELGLWADLIVIAPASANTIAKMANGICDNLLIATYLSAKCPVMFAPAMDLDMFIHPTSVQNKAKLQSFGNILIDANEGELASGLSGKGRMAEPEEIFEIIEKHFVAEQDLLGKKALVTAGPTYENIDPVRFIGNYSSGKMGFAIAEELAKRGAMVTLIAGPVEITHYHNNINRINVQSAEQMFELVNEYFSNSNISVMCAAVADYSPITVANEKIKKQNEDSLFIELKKTKDILKHIGSIKTDKQIVVGFALETNNEEENALIKLKEKNADFIVLNSLQTFGAGFKHDTNQVTILKNSGEKLVFNLKSKNNVANDIVNEIVKIINKIDA